MCLHEKLAVEPDKPVILEQRCCEANSAEYYAQHACLPLQCTSVCICTQDRTVSLSSLKCDLNLQHIMCLLYRKAG